MNTIGHIYRLTSFGESHGPAMGGVIDGMPAGVTLDLDEVQRYVNRRTPTTHSHSTQRHETDQVEFLSGIFEGKTLGTPIGFIVRNLDAHSSDYDDLRTTFRPSHADFTYQMKYGTRDHRGGGRASARETVSRVVAGAIAMQVLKAQGIGITAFTTRIGSVALTDNDDINLSAIDNNALRCPNEHTYHKMAAEVEQARAQGDTLGGVVRCIATGVRAGLGEPTFGRLDAALAHAMMSIPAARAFNLGHGMQMAAMRGSEAIDHFIVGNYGDVHLLENHSGGVLGGISTGDDIYFDVAFKPIATMMRPIESIDINAREVTITPRGRHDVCVVPRAVPIVEAMTAITLLDMLLAARATL